MADFEYSIQPGVTDLSTDYKRLFVVTRRLPDSLPGNFCTNIYAAALNQSSAWIGLLYRPSRLGELKFWHEIHSVNPNRLAGDLSDDARLDKRAILTKFALAAASGLVVQPQHNGAIDNVVATIVVESDALNFSKHLHATSEGVLIAHLGRVAQAL